MLAHLRCIQTQVGDSSTLAQGKGMNKIAGASLSFPQQPKSGLCGPGMGFFLYAA